MVNRTEAYWNEIYLGLETVPNPKRLMSYWCSIWAYVYNDTHGDVDVIWSVLWHGRMAPKQGNP